jgi:hypothetical protein
VAAPTEANLALLARCERLAARAARNQCVEAAVVAVQTRNRDVHIAQREPVAGSGR